MTKRKARKIKAPPEMPREKAQAPVPAPPVQAGGILAVFVRCVWILAGVLALAAVLSFTSRAAQAASLAPQGWPPPMVEKIIRNRTVALAHGAVMTACAAGMLMLLLRRRAVDTGGAGPGGFAWRPAMSLALVFIVAADAVWLSRHYVKTMPLSLLEENDVTRTIKSRLDHQRVALATRDSFYGNWLTYLFPYRGILTLNTPQMRSMPLRYSEFLTAVGANPLRLWQLSAVAGILGPAQIVGEMQRLGLSEDQFEVIFAFNVAEAGDGGVRVSPATREQPGQHAIVRLKVPAPRFALIGAWREAPDEEALRLLADPARLPLEEVLIPPEDAPGLPAGTGRGIVGSVEVVQYGPGRFKLKASAPQPAILRVAEKYEPDWKAWIDGKPQPVLRCDYLFQGVLVEPGLHEVELRYSPAAQIAWAQSAGALAVAGAAAALIFSPRRRQR